MSNINIPGGFFVTFEGPERAGKSTQVAKLATKLETAGYDVHVTREPGGTEVGEQLRYIVKHICDEEAVCDEAELLIFCASRAQLVRKRILPHLSRGGVVICDRFADSTTAYQGYGRGFELSVIGALHALSTCARWPDMTFLLDTDTNELFCSRRVDNTDNSDAPRDRIEEASRAFHEKVRRGYLSLAAESPDRFRVIDAADSIECIESKIWNEVMNALAEL